MFASRPLQTALLLAVMSLGGAQCTSTPVIRSDTAAPRFVRCTEDAACPDGFRCGSGVCIAKKDGAAATQLTCKADTTCGGGMECRSGRCVAFVTGCVQDYECGFGEACVRRVCTKKTPDRTRCATDEECSGQCVEGTCE